MSILTTAEIVQDLLDYVQVAFPSADVSQGAVLRDLDIEGVAIEAEAAYQEISAVQIMQEFTVNAESISVSDMTLIAQDYNITPAGPEAATGWITFRSLIQPTQTYTIGAAGGSGGVAMSTQALSDGTTVQFVTTATVYLSPTTPFNLATGYYEVVAPIVASTPGAAGNVPAGTILSLLQQINGVDSIVNVVPTDGGFDAESNTEIAAAITTQIQGSSKTNKAGYESTALSYPGVQAVLVVGPNDGDSIRGPGTLDIYILGAQMSTRSEDFVYSGQNDYLLSSHPVDTIFAVLATVGGVLTPLTPGIDYVFVKDAASAAAGSSYSQDKVRLLSTATKKPDPATSFSVEYSYNALVGNLQSYMDDSERAQETVDLMVKETSEVDVVVSMTAKLYAGQDKTANRNAIVTAIADKINSSGLGFFISQSDVDFLVRSKVPGVESIMLPFGAFSFVGGANQDTLVASATQYMRVLSDGISVAWA